jgi:glycerol uptake facilitator-like aquaporin
MWVLEFCGSFILVFLSLVVFKYLVREPCSALTYGLVSTALSFSVITPFCYFGGYRLLLNPAAAVLGRVQGKLVTKSVFCCAAAQVAGFLLAYAAFVGLCSRDQKPM